MNYDKTLAFAVRGVRFIGALATGLAAVGIAIALTVQTAAAASRIKDIADVEGVRENQLIGYGLVVGLNGTGDGLTNSPFTLQSLQAMLERLGVNTHGAKLKTALPGNVIRVKVTSAPSIILGDYNTKLANPKVILTQVDINKGNKQVAHGIDAVLLPKM